MTNAIIGGPHESFDFLANLAGGTSQLLSHFAQGLEKFRQGDIPWISNNPVSIEEVQFAKTANLQLGEFENIVNLQELVDGDGLFEESSDEDKCLTVSCGYCQDDILLEGMEVITRAEKKSGKQVKNKSDKQLKDVSGNQLQQEQAMVNADERIANIRKWRELMDAGLNINYRCVKCRNCHDCRNADETEKVSLREEVEDEKIKESVTVDDMMDSKGTLEEIKKIARDGYRIFEEVDLDCKGWTFTGEDPPEIAGDDQTVGVAGQTWASKADVVLYNIPPLHFGIVRRGGKAGRES